MLMLLHVCRMGKQATVIQLISVTRWCFSVVFTAWSSASQWLLILSFNHLQSSFYKVTIARDNVQCVYLNTLTLKTSSDLKYFNCQYFDLSKQNRDIVKRLHKSKQCFWLSFLDRSWYCFISRQMLNKWVQLLQYCAIYDKTHSELIN